MDTDFRFQIAKCIFTFGRKCNTFDAGLIARLKIDQFELEAPAFDPPRIHPEEHFSPVLGLRTAGTRIDRYNGISEIIFSIQHYIKRQPIDQFVKFVSLLGDFVKGRFIGFLQRQIQQNLVFFQIVPQLFKAVDFVGN